MTENGSATSSRQGADPLLLAAVVTPMREGGTTIDEDAIEPVVRFVEDNGCDGLFISGTVGEGFLLSGEERRRLARAYCEASSGRRIFHAGAQTTAETVALAAYGAEVGADAVAVIAPPYFRLSDEALVEHFVAAAAACAPLPFFIYAFSACSGYPTSADVVKAVGERADNLVGMKVSESAWEAVAPFLDLGLEVLIGSDPLLPRALEAGAAGAASAMAGVAPDRFAAILGRLDARSSEAFADLRTELVPGDMIPGLKLELRRRGIPVATDVRAPLRPAVPDPRAVARG
jgi:dihydrodipicolinate synthase/N-acetylneuraminate lyase